ncbi:MAG: ATP-dependent DNA helicase RecG [Actinobacteria bacterium]|nr:ATP-dependent DNA helicase RecG [Ilumatobacteraceae bacterium]MCX6532246.1 ATP-dependent DNA helicase RecG [Actinomycetota bacterium]
MTGKITLHELADIDVEVLKGVGEKRKESLAEYGITNVLELLMNYPRKWVDRTNEARVSDLVAGQEALVIVEVRKVSKFTTKNRRTVVTIQVGDESGRLTAVFFNQPWRERQLKVGLQVAMFGKPDLYRGVLQMSNPLVDLIGDRTGRIVPIYPQSEKTQVSTWELATWVENALERCRERGLSDPVPTELINRLELVDRTAALWGIHFPETMLAKQNARRRLAFDELLRVQVVLVGRKRAFELDSTGIRHIVDGKLQQRFVAAIPFALTAAQQRVISEINKDLAAPHPMHRLLQGDVGSGKTVVAVSAMLAAVQGGHQGALMAPTEVLAEQHFASVSSLLAGLLVPDAKNLFGDRQLRVELLTSRITSERRRELLRDLANGGVDILIGTHALIQEGVEFSSLGVAVIDEQHRFGVEQRAALRNKGESTVSQNSEKILTSPDVLVMTATPIPRTAAMTVYGDLDVSVLDEMPPGRTPIKTFWIAGKKSESAMWDEVRGAAAHGQQAFVVCPLIEESDKLQVASAEDTFKLLAKTELKGLKLGLLHGRMSSSEKDETMNKFRNRKLDVLVATTVIEVGVDVPNATCMVVLDADRFGIAQLHQLRGRVGRGVIASRCWLVTSDPEVSSARIDALVESTDGFYLAEVDLELRGEGTIMNTAQKGRSDLKLASLRQDRDLIELARATAFEIINADPTLKSHNEIREEIDLLLTPDEEEFLFKN